MWLAAVAGAFVVATAPLGSQPVVRMDARDQALRREARQLHAVGAAEGRGADVFGGVAGVAFDGAENLYVLDRVNARVAVFDSAGRFVRTLGRRGGGPGEFSLPQQMAVTRAGEVIVSDAGHGALIIFGRDGSARSVRYPGVGTLMGRTLAPHPRGGVVSLAMGNPAAGGANAIGEETLLWIPTGAGASRTLASVSTPRGRGAGSAGSRERPAFSPSFRFAVLADGGVAVADGTAYAIRILDSSGRVLRVLQRPIAPRRVTARDREHEMDWRESLASSGGIRIVGPRGAVIPAPVLRRVGEELRDVEFADVMPVIRRMGVDAAGNLWIERAGPSMEQSGGVDIVTPAGRYLRTLAGWRLPDAFSPHGRAAYIREDENGVQRVVVVRI
ncbi:6-bladed beta-propeller [Longimicrobium terrae]|nr:6-bladed beta-propeller [Longimicrobium terrae]MBB4639230.1 hypothetical protein [Longimicrobium terrae]